ncbi:MAG TPA: YsnF/AvaK domain-containing protein [Candidatus Dormibacteraeota bacterium]|jgi:uncharacterized protein (TIGR02271 family)
MSDQAAVTGVFENSETAQSAVDALREAGFHQEVIDVKEPTGKLFDALLPEEDRDRNTTVSVMARERRLEAADILRRHGAHDIDAGMDQGRSEAASGEDGERVALLEEELVPRTVAVQTGEIRVRKRVVVETRTIEVPIRREEVVVERVAVPHPQSILAEEDAQADPQRLGPSEPLSELGADQDITRIPVLEEQIILQKRVVVREYVTVNKRIIEEPKTVSGTIRREEPRIEQEGKAPIVGNAAGDTTLEREAVAPGQPNGGHRGKRHKRQH